MKSFRKAHIFRLVVAAAVLLLTSQTVSPALGKDVTFFTYRIEPGVTIKGVPMTYVPLGKAYGIRYTVNNIGQSGPGKLNLKMYSDGTLVWSQSTADITANGTYTRLIPAPVFAKTTKSHGPFYLCANAQLAKGDVEPKAPCSQWSWMAIEVPIAYVSNGCGGMTGSTIIDNAQKTVLDKRKIGGVVVDFRDACNIHDAGYSGVTVKNLFLKNTMVDYKNKSRALVDLMFKSDLSTRCVKYFGTPSKAKYLSTCLTWAQRYYTAVRLVGKSFYDTDPTKPGIQTEFVENVIAGLPVGFGVERSNA